MIVFITLFFALLFLFVKGRISDILPRYFINAFLIYWFIVLAISTINPMGLYEVSLEGYLCQLVFVLSVILGYVSYIKQDEQQVQLSPLPILKSRKFYIVVFVGIIIVISMYSFKRQVMVLSEMDSAYFRMDFFEVMFAGKPFLLYTYYLFLYPLYFFLLSLLSYCLFFERNWKCILLCAMYLLPFMSLSEGRMAYMILAIYLLFAFILYRRMAGFSFHISKKVYGTGMVILIGLYFLMATVTANRTGQNNLQEGANELNSTIISYSILPMRTFDYAINNDYIAKSGGPHFGRASFCGFDFLISSLSKRVGIDIPSIRDETNGLLQNNSVPVGSSSTANYSFTAAIYPYMDFGFWGILIVPLIFGLFCKKQLQNLMNNFSLYSYALCGFLFFIMLHTPFSWYFNKIFTIPYILFLMIMHKRRCLTNY